MARAVRPRLLAARRAGPARIIAAAAAAATAMTTRSHGNQPGLRPSSTQAQEAVTSSVPARVTRAAQVCRIRHNATPPMPASAAIAGARATV